MITKARTNTAPQYTPVHGTCTRPQQFLTLRKNRSMEPNLARRMERGNALSYLQNHLVSCISLVNR